MSRSEISAIISIQIEEKDMYKILTILVCFLALSQNVYAHPPSSIDLVYNKNSQVFTLTINHRIAGKGHFIKQITVNINGEEIKSKTYTFQQKGCKLLFPQA